MTTLINNFIPFFKIKTRKEESQNIPNEKLPSSCRDLNLLGHTLNGIYFTQLEMNSNKLAAVFCDFRPFTGCLGDSCAGGKISFT